MDEKKFLIRTRQKGKWRFTTKSIIKIEDLGDTYEITFSNSSKSYTYKNTNVEYFAQPKKVNIERSIVHIKGKPDKQWDSVLAFGPYLCLYKNSNCQVEQLSDVELHPNIADDPSVRKLREYYQYIASLVKKETPHLDYYYTSSYLDILREDSVLKVYVDSATPNSFSTDLPIFPFGVNPSQRQAVFSALENQISLIQGPPGTGKTQTILNIIANLVFQGKSVAVVAGNNSATDNVYEKLESVGLGFMVARLGKNEFQRDFFESKRELPKHPDWKINDRERLLLDKERVSLNKLLVELLETKNNYAKINESISRLQIEKQYFNKNFPVESVNPEKWSFFNNWSTPSLLSFMAELRYYSKDEKVAWPTKLRWLYKFRIYKFKDLDKIDSEVLLGVISEFYNRRLDELRYEQHRLKKLLNKHDFEKMLSQYSQVSLRLFKGNIENRYRKIEDVEWKLNSYKNNFSVFLDRFPVLLSTTDSIINNKSPFDLFDYVIVDEASQVDLVTGFLSMSCAKNIVAVGDLKQLPHIPNELVSKSKRKIDEAFNIDPRYSYIQESLLSSLTRLFSDIVPTTLLVEHYRCHPRIIDFCNQKFYGGQLVIMTEDYSDPFKVLKTVPGNHGRKPSPPKKGWINIREIEVIENEVIKGELIDVPHNCIGITSPYREQVNAAKKYISSNELQIDTVYKYQGREKDAIIFTTTVNQLNNFVDAPCLLNVAVSRAKKYFILVTSDKLFKNHGSNIGDLIRHIEYQSMSPSIFESKIVSIFDCLYNEYSDVLEKFSK